MVGRPTPAGSRPRHSCCAGLNFGESRTPGGRANLTALSGPPGTELSTDGSGKPTTPWARMQAVYLVRSATTPPEGPPPAGEAAVVVEVVVPMRATLVGEPPPQAAALKAMRTTPAVPKTARGCRSRRGRISRRPG